MKKFYIYLLLLLIPFYSYEQYLINTFGTTNTINFNGFTGAGFHPSPSPGQLNSNIWAVTGLSDGQVIFGDTGVTGDFARGFSSGSVTTGGIYAFFTGTDTILGAQPVGVDFTPGSFILRLKNNTGFTINRLQLGYLFYYFNDENRSVSFTTSFSTDSINYFNIPGLSDTTKDTADITPVWNFNVKSANIPNISIPSNSTFFIKWTCDDAGGSGSRDEIGINNITIIAYNDLIASFKTNTNVCVGDSVLFSDSTYGGYPPYSYSWNFNDSTSQDTSSQNPIHVFYNPGTYNVTLTVSDTASNIDDTVITVVVNPKPNASFSFIDTKNCGYTSVVFNDSSSISSGTITNWNWDFGDGNSDTIQNTSHNYLAGNYIVTLTVTSDKACKDSVSNAIFSVPFEAAVSIFDATSPACKEDTVIFSDMSAPMLSIVSWNWDFGDSSYSNIQNPTHQYMTYGNFPVTLIVTTDSGCTDTSTQIISIYDKPQVSFSFSNTCLGDTTIFTDQSTINGATISTRQWDFGDGNLLSTSSNTVQHIYSTASTYLVNLNVTSSNGCSSNLTQQIDINPPPVANFSFTTNNDTAFFNDISSSTDTISSWLWNFGDGIGTSTLQNPFYIYQQTGTFYSCLTVNTINNCSDTYCDTVNIIISSIENYTGKEKIKIYPTIAKNKIKIDISPQVAVGIIDIYNVEGKIIKSFNFNASKSYLLDISKLKKGMYLVLIRGNDFSQKTKFVKQ